MNHSERASLLSLRAIFRMLMLGFGLLCSPYLWAETILSLGVVPQFPKERIQTDWSPVIAALEKQGGIKLELKFYTNIPAFEKAFLNGEIDVAYLNPYHAVMAYKEQGYIPIVRDDKQRLTGLLVVRKDSPIQKIEQLNGTTIAFPAPNAFGASLYMRALLTAAKVQFTPEYRNTHSNVYRHVLNGRAVAGGGVVHTLEKEPAEVQEGLRVLYETPPAYAHPVVVHPRVDKNLRQKLQQTWLQLGKQQADLFKEIQMTLPVATSYADYAPLEKLGLERFVILEE